jgi:hypothetical protein
MSIKKRLLVVICGVTLCVGAASAQVVVRMGPPPPVVVERPGRALHAGWVWIPGYYRWNGRRYIWMPGRWAAPPRPRAIWVPGPMGSSRWRLGLGQRILALGRAARAGGGKLS